MGGWLYRRPDFSVESTGKRLFNAAVKCGCLMAVCMFRTTLGILLRLDEEQHTMLFLPIFDDFYGT